MLHELVSRFHAPTPAFWQKVRNRCLLAVGVLTPLDVVLSAEPLHTWLQYAIAVLGGIATAAQLTCDSPPPAATTPEAQPPTA